jgi:hypothetical protein
MKTATLDQPLAFESDEESLHALTAKLLGLKKGVYRNLPKVTVSCG